MGTKPRKPKQHPPGKPQAALQKPASPAPPRKLWFRAALVFAPFLLLGLFELGLRMVGYGYSPDFFERARIGGQTVWVENDRFSLRFFPPRLARIPVPLRMSLEKPKNTTRIFIFGESAALGDPCPNYGAGRYLEVLLRERFPGRKFEIINTSITAIDSHVILPIARECAQHDGDIWLIYMGNNEMVGPFGAATVFGRQAPPLKLVRLSLALRATRTGQLLSAIARKLSMRPTASSSWHGMEMFLRNSVPPTDPRRKTVYDSFQKNLEDILKLGIQAKAKVILNTVAVNLKDCPPFGSVTGTNLPEADALRFAQLCTEASDSLAKRHFTNAGRYYQNAAQLCPFSAQVQFGLGQSRLQLSNYTAAAENFSLACDYDVLPFRADSHLNRIVAETAREFPRNQVVLCDAASLLSTNTPSGIPGQETFFEHVHLNWDGNYRLARLWAATVAELLPPSTKKNERGSWLPQAQCERWLGLTDWNRLAILEEVTRRLRQPPFKEQDNNAQRLQMLKRREEALQRALGSTPTNELRQVYQDALARAPQDYRLHENYAEFLESIGQLKAALSERQQVATLTPDYYFSQYSLGMVLKNLGQFAEAENAFRNAIALNPNQGELRRELGIVLARQGEWARALQNLDRARSLDPADPRPLLYSAEALSKLGRPTEGVGLLRQAIRLEPAYWEAHYRLGEALARQQQLEPAAKEFQEVVQLKPDFILAHLNLGVALFQLGRLEEAQLQFDETLRLDPGNSLALTFKERAQEAILRRTP